MRCLRVFDAKSCQILSHNSTHLCSSAHCVQAPELCCQSWGWQGVGVAATQTLPHAVHAEQLEKQPTPDRGLTEDDCTTHAVISGTGDLLRQCMMCYVAQCMHTKPEDCMHA